MSELARQRCFTHAGREAAARCPACRRFFCRECVTEHAGRMVCASCLKALAGGDATGGGRLRAAAGGLKRLVQCGAGLLVAWSFYYALGRLLQLLPPTVHEGAIWERLGR